MPIKSFKHKGLKELFETGKSSKIGIKFVKRCLRIMDFLWGIADLKDCNGVYDFHPLTGNRKGTYSMHVNGNYCITFKWKEPDVYDLDFDDYH